MKAILVSTLIIVALASIFTNNKFSWKYISYKTFSRMELFCWSYSFLFINFFYVEERIKRIFI